MKDRKPTLSFAQLSAKLLEELSRKCYRSATMDNYRRVLSRIGNYMDREGLCSYTGEVGEAFIADRLSGSYISKSHTRFIQTVVRRLNDVNAGIEYQLVERKPTPLVPERYSEPLESYLRHCTNLGNKESTISCKRRICSKFLCSLTDLGCLNVHEISTDYICRAIIRHSNRDDNAVIRAFLQYLHEASTLKLDYSGIIPKYSRSKILPTTYSADEVQRLEATVDRSSKVGKRDYAVFLLATRLGLRSGDIVGLTYDKVDFAGNTISLAQEKTNQPLSLPLLPGIREAIEEYIQHARPNSDSKYVFLSSKAPFGRMTSSIIRNALSKWFLAAGINTSGKKHGPHSLRSSLASAMVNDGIPYEVVRRLLGHSDPDAIKHYAKIDIENLRLYAIDVPPPTGKFKDLLEGRVRQW